MNLHYVSGIVVWFTDRHTDLLREIKVLKFYKINKNEYMYVMSVYMHGTNSFLYNSVMVFDSTELGISLGNNIPLVAAKW